MGSYLDSLDLKIIDFLTKDGRMPYLQIAKLLKLSESAIRKRVKNLEERGVIKKYTIYVDHGKVGFGNVAFVGVDVDGEKYFDVAKNLKTIDQVKFAATSTGDHMFMLEVWAKDNDEMHDVCQQIKRIEGVTRICPAIVKDTLKGEL
ncbi:Lrp/AsnC family transcriptional regulator [Candidatus Woesearchaeota archaeon]|nr:Lrp/AsnC family transcriptional regulator [Candidatus Woesearchaeota archaeon]